MSADEAAAPVVAAALGDGAVPRPSAVAAWAASKCAAAAAWARGVQLAQVPIAECAVDCGGDAARRVASAEASCHGQEQAGAVCGAFGVTRTSSWLWCSELSAWSQDRGVALWSFAI